MPDYLRWLKCYAQGKARTQRQKKGQMYTLADVCKYLPLRMIDKHKQEKHDPPRRRTGKLSREEEEAAIRAMKTPREDTRHRVAPLPMVKGEDGEDTGEVALEGPALPSVDQAAKREQLTWLRDVLLNTDAYDDPSVQIARAALELIREGLKPSYSRIGQRCGGLSKSAVCRRIAKIRERHSGMVDP